MAILKADLLGFDNDWLLPGVPSLVSAAADPGGEFIALVFDHALAPGALVIGNFQILGGGASPVFPTSVDQPSPGQVRVFVTEMEQNAPYTVVVLTGTMGEGGGTTQSNQYRVFSGVAIPRGKLRYTIPHWLTARFFNGRGAWSTRFTGRTRIF